MSPEVAEDFEIWCIREDSSQLRLNLAKFFIPNFHQKTISASKNLWFNYGFRDCGRKIFAGYSIFHLKLSFLHLEITFRQVMLGISRKHTFRQCLILNVLWFSFKQENSQAPATKIFVYFSNLIFSVVFPFFSPPRALWSAGQATVWLNTIPSHATFKSEKFSQDTGARHRCLCSLRFMLQIARR